MKGQGERMSSLPTVMGSTSASDEHVADDASNAEPSKIESDKAKKEKSYYWIRSNSLDDGVFHETEWVQLGGSQSLRRTRWFRRWRKERKHY
jgi:hypothetical protein